MTNPAKSPPDFKPDLSTPERRARDDVVVVGKAKSEKQAVALSKVHRMHLDGGIDQPQFAAAIKLALHRHYGKQDGSPKPMVLERVDGMGSASGGFTASDHADAYFEACRLISGRGVTAFLAFVLDDVSKDQCSKMLGDMRKSERLEQFNEIIVRNLTTLASHWGLITEPIYEKKV